MKRFRYPLERLKQFRELELVTAADEMRQLLSKLHEVQTRISEKQSAIQDTQRALVDSETKTGTIRPDLRKLTALYVQSVQLEQEKLEEVLQGLEQEQEQAHAHLVEKKQSVKMLENHHERLSTDYQSSLQSLQQKEDDELWLIRQKNKQAVKPHEHE